MLYEKLSKQSGGLKYSSGLMKHMYVHTRLFFGFKEKMRGKTLLILIRKVIGLVIIASFLKWDISRGEGRKVCLSLSGELEAMLENSNSCFWDMYQKVGGNSSIGVNCI